ncbi:MAG: beta-lactamase family protein [Leptolyngbyaceae cyanobacterium RU_5_1]|nr:beta-lactamase family protein [Leptolyngbyaceae cyanobacterium RU_5_1]
MPTNGTVEGNLAERVDAFITDVASKGYAGSLVVEKDGALILAKGYGFANQREKVPVTPDTIFDIGSVTKQFTAAAILKLEEQGKLKAEDTISLYFDNVPEDKQNITLHQLLTHTAGFPESLANDYAPTLKDEYIDLAMGAKLTHPSGETYNYSNTGYSLLAAIIELVTGGSYETYLHNHLFTSAGMMQTGYVLPDWQKDKLARGYTRLLGFSRDTGTPLDHPFAEDGPYWNLRGNGGILSTAMDMYRWHQALQGNTILSESTKKNMFTPYVSEGYEQESYYGYGWVIMSTSQGRLQTHNGGNDIFFADIHRYIDVDTFIFITSSTGLRHNATELSWQAANILFD